jgi:hypothetical protein
LAVIYFTTPSVTDGGVEGKTIQKRQIGKNMKENRRLVLSISLDGKKKVMVFSLPVPLMRIGGVKVQFHSFLTSTLERGESLTSRIGCFTSG